LLVAIATGSRASETGSSAIENCPESAGGLSSSVQPCRCSRAGQLPGRKDTERDVQERDLSNKTESTSKRSKACTYTTSYLVVLIKRLLAALKSLPFVRVQWTSQSCMLCDRIDAI
jgi:hypothetical protein